MALLSQISFTDRERQRRREASKRAKKRKRMKPMTETDLAEKVQAEEVRARDEELRAIDDHIRKLEAFKTAGGGSLIQLASGVRSSKDAAVASELGQAHELREALAASHRAPVEHRRDGRRVDVHDRRFILMRTRELREQLWAKAEIAEGRGDYQEATRYRLDALRSRHLAEHEFGLRPHLPGY